MSDYFAVVEYVKPFSLDTTLFTYAEPFIVSAKLTTDSLHTSSSYFYTTLGATDSTNKLALNIKSLFYEISTIYTSTTSLADCRSNESSYYFDFTNQILYIHVDHDVNFFAHAWEYGKVFGYTSDQVREFNGIPYLPEVISIPNLRLETDPLQYQVQGFYGGNVVMKNQLGQWDAQTGFIGNDVFIYIGQDGDSYTDLFMVTNNYLVNIKKDFEQCVLETKDRREQRNKKIPIDTFTAEVYPNINTDLIGKIKPDAYGTCRGVPGICVNENEGNVPKTFYFASAITGTPTFYKNVDDKWTAVVAASIDNANGTATFSVANSHVDGDWTKGLLNIKATGTFVNYSNPGDIIADMNNRFLSISYNSSNYDTTEWTDEKQWLENVGLYMDEQKNLYEWIGKLQAGSTVGFMYLFYNGKLTMRLDNPNRNVVNTIPAVLIKNNGNIESDENAELFATHARIQYNQDYKDKVWESEEDWTYYNTVFSEHRKDKQYDEDSLLITSTNAANRAIIILEDQSQIRPLSSIILHGKEWFSLRLYDLLDVQLSYPGEKIGTETVDLYEFDESAVDTYEFDDDTSGVDIYEFVDYTQRDIMIHEREFLGWQKMQIIGLLPNFETADIEIKLRQRDYSDLFASITGYTP